MESARGRSGWGPVVFVGCVWLLSSYLLVEFVRTYGVNFPHFDEWENVPAITGEQPVTLKWLWSQHNEHRIVVPRLVYLGLAKLTHGDFRAGMAFNVTVLSLEALLLVVTARRIRGTTEYSDAFFPLVLQTWGQAENLYWSFQVQFICSAALSVAFLVLSVRSSRLSTAEGMGIGVCGLLLPLVGGNGLAFAPAVSASIALAGWGEWRRPRGRRRALALWAMGLAAVALTAFYFVDYTRPAKHPPSPSRKATFDAAIQFLSGGFGQVAKMLWPESKNYVLAGVAFTFALLVGVVLVRPAERYRAMRLVLVLGGMLCLALGLGWARIALASDAMFAPRYPTLAAPFWCAVYLAFELPGRRQLRGFAQACLFLCAATLAYENYDIGKQTAEGHRGRRAAIVADIQAGVHLPEILRRHGGFTYYGGNDVLGERMRMLHARSIGVFRDLKE
jgi:hypothetical protein